MPVLQPTILLVNVILLPTMCDGLGGMYSCCLRWNLWLKGSEECDGGAGCTSCACDANWRSTTLFLLIVNVIATLHMSRWTGGMYCLRWSLQLKDQKNVMVELDATSCACDANWKSATPVSTDCECDASANYIDDGLGMYSCCLRWNLG